MGFCRFSDMLIQRCVQPRQAQTRKVLLFSWESFQSRRERLGKRKLGNFQSWFARYQNRRSMGVGRQGKFVLIFSCLSGLDNLFICACSAAQACANIAGPLRKRSASWQSHFFWEKESLDFLSSQKFQSLRKLPWDLPSSGQATSLVWTLWNSQRSWWYSARVLQCEKLDIFVLN